MWINAGEILAEQTAVMLIFYFQVYGSALSTVLAYELKWQKNKTFKIMSDIGH